MRLFRVRRAHIPEDHRALFERFGSPVIAGILAGGFTPRAPVLQPVYNQTAVTESASMWLTEQYDRAERKENWLLLMEIAITLLVATELWFTAYDHVVRWLGPTFSGADPWL